NDTAQKRVSRALDKLRDLLGRKGITRSSAALALLLSAHSVQAAPVGLSVTICGSTVLSSAMLKTTSLGFTKTLFMTTFQKTIVLTAFATVLGTGIYEAERAAHFQNQAVVLKKQRDVLAEENEKLRRTNNWLPVSWRQRCRKKSFHPKA
ncbi:MAG: hypothetical protein JWN25_545, partial [Verrucomicrobiales bacterium]|nr:hypothetical protein [Verrucomicrobiales bacterium]